MFRGETDGVTTPDWKQDVKRSTEALGVDDVEIQRLVSFSLQ